MRETTSDRFEQPVSRRSQAFAYGLLLAFVGLLVLLQILPLTLPLGPMFWDTLIYYDAIGRMANGQVPVLDFFIPVGPFEYYLAYFSNSIFPNANPILMTQWIWLPVSAPVVALILWDVGRRSFAAAIGLLIPWMLFTALPFNVVDFYPFPGTDGFGIYNRHGAHLLYLVAATVLFVRQPLIKTITLSILVTGLAFCKITAFIAAGPILLFGFALGRISLVSVFATALICAALAGALELATGMVSVYLSDILLLASQNSGAILPRFFTVISQRFDVLAAGGLLCIALLLAHFRHPPQREGLAGFLDSDWFWIGILLFSGLFYETQNTGSHAFIMVWPGLLAVLLRQRESQAGLRTAILVLVAFTAIPTATKVTHKAIRTAAVAPGYIKLDAPDLGVLGNISAKDIFVERAERMKSVYPNNHKALEDIAATEALPAFLLFADPDYQYLNLLEIQNATVAIKELEAQSGRVFETILNLDFANPFPFILDRVGPKHVAIGADPSRAVPDPDERTLQSIRNTDLVLLPTCPIHYARKTLEALYMPGLTGHEKRSLTPCFDAYVRPAS